MENRRWKTENGKLANGWVDRFSISCFLFPVFHSLSYSPTNA